MIRAMILGAALAITLALVEMHGHEFVMMMR